MILYTQISEITMVKILRIFVFKKFMANTNSNSKRFW